MSIEVEYPIPKKCIVCHTNFYVGSKIKRTSNSIKNFYSNSEKMLIQLMLNIILPKDIVFNIIEFLRDENIINFGHYNCCDRKNKNILWLIHDKRNMHMIRK